MFGLGFAEVLAILVVALLVFGPKKLPEVARVLGRSMGHFRRASDEFRREINLPKMDLDSVLEPSNEERYPAEEKRKMDEPAQEASAANEEAESTDKEPPVG